MKKNKLLALVLCLAMMFSLGFTTQALTVENVVGIDEHVNCDDHDHEQEQANGENGIVGTQLVDNILCTLFGHSYTLYDVHYVYTDKTDKIASLFVCTISYDVWWRVYFCDRCAMAKIEEFTKKVEHDHNRTAFPPYDPAKVWKCSICEYVYKDSGVFPPITGLPE